MGAIEYISDGPSRCANTFIQKCDRESLDHGQTGGRSFRVSLHIVTWLALTAHAQTRTNRSSPNKQHLVSMYIYYKK